MYSIVISKTPVNSKVAVKAMMIKMMTVTLKERDNSVKIDLITCSRKIRLLNRKPRKSVTRSLKYRDSSS